MGTNNKIVVEEANKLFGHLDDSENLIYGFKVGCINQHKRDVDEFVEWLRNNWREYVDADADGVVRFGGWENDLRRALSYE